jgi:hypothetical protein
MLIYDEWQVSVAVFFIILAAMSVVFLGAGKWQEGIRHFLFTNRWIFGILFLGNILATVLLQKLLHVNYPEDRTAMYFYFFLVGFFCFALDHLPFKKIKHVAWVWLVAPVHFLCNINITHSAYWYYEHIPNSFYTEIQKRAGDHPEEVSIGGYVLMDMIWAYYNHAGGGRLNDIQTKDYPSFYYDYLLLYDDNNNAFAQDYYNTIMRSPYSKISLLEKKEKIKLNLITEYKLPDMINTKDEFINFYESDSLKKYENLCFEFKTHFQNNDDFFFGMFSLGTDVNGTPATLETQEMHLTRTEWKKGYDFHHRLYIQGVSPATTRMVLYFWNTRKKQATLTGNSVKIYYWQGY